MKKYRTIYIVLLSMLILTGCKDKKDYSIIDNESSSVKNEVHKILITDVKGSDAYTYIHVNEAGKKYWMAIPKIDVKVGDVFYYDGGMTMKNFESKELNKTFDEIIFAGSIRVDEKASGKDKEDIYQNTQKTDNEDFKLLKLNKPENGITIKELLSNKESYSKKEVIVRGKVVKVNKKILDRNWIHIIDGSEFENKTELTITSSDLFKIGDTVTFKGIVAIDKDFGYGYVYPVLLEKGEQID